MNDSERRPPRAPIAVLVTCGLALLIVLGAALGGSLRFSGPRWQPGAGPSRPPLVETHTPQPLATASIPPAPTAHAGPDLSWVVILVAALAAAVLLFFVIRWLLRRGRERTEAAAGSLNDVPLLEPLVDDPSVETSMPYLRRGLRRALSALDGDRSPTDAIIQAWLGLQEAAEDAGFQRGDSETPTEFTSRILHRVDVDPAALGTLRRLYLAVRFGDAVATDDDVSAARAALQTLQAQWETTPSGEVEP